MNIIKEKLIKIKNSVWFYPATIGALSILGAFLIILVDSRYFIGLNKFIPDIFSTSVELAKTVHGIIAGAFITITTFTFSITMVVLTMYMSQLSPRVVENFLKTRNTTKSFGVFVGGFIYSITSLLFTKNVPQDQLVISATVGVIYMIVGLVYFLIFINSVTTFIQMNNVIDRLHQKSIEKIEEYKRKINENTIVKKINKEKYITDVDVRSKESGYIQKLAYEDLFKIADEESMIIVFDKVIGQFLSEGERIFTIYQKTDKEIEEKTIEKVNNLVIIGGRKTEEQDFSYTIQKIVEVALRALSPGINDPNTAIHCIRIIGVLLGVIASFEEGYIVIDKAKDKEGHVLLRAYSFKMILRDSLNQIIHYGSKDVLVSREIFKALKNIAYKSKDLNKEIILEYSNYAYRKTSDNLAYEYEIDMIDEEMKKIENRFKKETDVWKQI